MERHPLVLPFYQWPNGAKAELYVDPAALGPHLRVQIWVTPRLRPVTKGNTKIRFSCAEDRHFHVISTVERIPYKWICRLRGLFLDLGALSSGPLLIPNLLQPISGSKDLHINHCRFVPDSVWNSRYELSYEKTGEGRLSKAQWPGFEDFFPGLKVGEMEHGWLARWVAYRPETSARSTKEETIDEMLRRAKVLPESQRGQYELEHVRRGVFLHPSPEEIEVLNLIGEPLPFFLKPEEVWEWALSRKGVQHRG